MRVAIVGSRRWPERSRVESFVAGVVKKYPNVEIISGGAAGVDRWGERVALSLGVCVWSFRPARALVDMPTRPWVRLPRDDGETPLSEADEAKFAAWREAMIEYEKEAERIRKTWLVVLHRLQADPADPLATAETQRVLPGRYHSFRDAAFARNTMIVQRADEVVAFHHRDSPGTRHTRSEAERLHTRLHVFEA